MQPLLVADLITVAPVTVSMHAFLRRSDYGDPGHAGYRAAQMLSCYKFGALLPVVDSGELVRILSVTDLTNSPPSSERWSGSTERRQGFDI